MFFGNPDAAFRDLRRAVRQRGRLAFLCWRAMADNPWVAVPVAALRTVLPPPPRPGPEDPGPFSFADRARVARIISAGGFSPPRFEQANFQMRTKGAPAKAAKLVTQIGPASRMLRDAPEGLRSAALAAVAEAIAPLSAKREVRPPASAWVVTADGQN
jgi:hypothetical protein